MKIIASKNVSSKNGVSKKLCSIALLLTTVFTGCASISPYNAKAYEQATSIKATALITMTKAQNPYQESANEIEDLILEMDRAYEYAKGRPKNSESIRQWEIMKDPEQKLLGGFIQEWKTKQKLNTTYVELKKKQVGLGFDQIIELEGGKRK